MATVNRDVKSGIKKITETHISDKDFSMNLPFLVVLGSEMKISGLDMT